MIDFCMGDLIRFFLCMYIYYKDCIEDWLVRFFTCSFCMEFVEVVLLLTYYEVFIE